MLELNFFWFLLIFFLRQNMSVPVTCCVLTNSDAEHPKPENSTECQLDAHRYIQGYITSSRFMKTKVTVKFRLQNFPQYYFS